MKEDIEKYLGAIVYINHKGARFAARVTNIKQPYGKLRFKVSPVAGEGESEWLENISIKEE